MPAAAQRVTTTSAPTVTRSNRSAMSSLSMRMQPYEANVPIESGRFVPWIAYSPPESVMAATPIGLLGAPPGHIRQVRVVGPHLGGRPPSPPHLLAPHMRP